MEGLRVADRRSSWSGFALVGPLGRAEALDCSVKFIAARCRPNTCWQQRRAGGRSSRINKDPMAVTSTEVSSPQSSLAVLATGVWGRPRGRNGGVLPVLGWRCCPGLFNWLALCGEMMANGHIR